MSKVLNFITRHKVLLSLLLALLLGAVVVWLGFELDRQLGSQSILIQVVQLILTTFATIIPARILVQRQEAEINKNRARMALRRIETLASQMNQVADYIEEQRRFLSTQSTKGAVVNAATVSNSLESISAMHKLQYSVINDIGTDWQDVIPDEIERIKKTQIDNRREDERN